MAIYNVLEWFSKSDKIGKTKNTAFYGLQEVKIYSSSGRPVCRWVCFFMGTDLEKFSITSLAHQWILYSEWVPSEWESKELILKTSQ